MNSPIIDLNASIPVTSIVQTLNTNINSELVYPVTGDCPFCKTPNSFKVFKDLNHPAGGGWVYCRACEFSGDSIAYFKKYYRLNSIPQVLGRLKADKVASFPFDLCTPVSINYYKTAYETLIEAPIRFWKAARHRLLRGDENCWELLRAKNLWTGRMHSNWRETLARYIGFATPDMFTNYIGDCPISNQNFLIIPFYDNPGRIRSFLLHSSNDTDLMYYIYNYTNQDDTDSGLVGLNYLNGNEDTLYATDNIWAMLRMARKELLNTSTPLKFVAYTNRTGELSWSHLTAKKTIFWSPKTTINTFSAAKQCPNSWVASRPDSESIESYVARTPVSKITETMQLSSSRWPESFKNYILYNNEDDVVSELSAIDLTSSDISKIRNCCTVGEWKKVQSVFGFIEPSATALVGNYIVYPAPEGWMAKKGRSHPTQITSFHMEIVHTVYNQSTDQNFIRGFFSVPGFAKTLPFNADLDEFELNPKRWIQKHFMKSGIGLPRIAVGWERKILDIAQQFRQPSHIQATQKIGYNTEEGSFVFPSFTIREGQRQIGYMDIYIDQKTLPFSGISLSGDNPLDNETISTWYNPSIMAALVMIIANLASPMYKQPPLPIAVVGSTNLIDILKDQFNLLTINKSLLKSVSEKDLNSKLKKLAIHDAPYILDRDGLPPIASWAPAMQSTIITPMTRLEALATATRGNWAYLLADHDLNPSIIKHLPAALRFLGHLQQIELKGDSVYTFCIMDEFITWISEIYPKAEAILNQIHQKLHPLSFGNTYSLDERFVMLLCELYNNGYISKETASFSSESNKNLIIAPIEDKVYINKVGSIAAIEKAGLPAPDISDITLSLHNHEELIEDTGEYWVIRKTFFNQVSSDWLSLFKALS